MAQLDIEEVEVRLGGRPVLENLSLAVEDGECLALLGPSGCGKTTTLRTVAGFLSPRRGDVRIGQTSVKGVPPNKRNVGIVFQDYALFPHMTVGENVAYGLEVRGLDRAEIVRRVGEALEQVRLPDFGKRYPQEMSGGQRQRVALARAIVVRPDILLLDEPLGALDRRLRDAMQVELKQLQRDVGITTIIVTHDQEEALSLSDRVAVMFDGQIAAIGPPAQLYARPERVPVMEFLGEMNLIEGNVSGTTLVSGSLSLPLPADLAMAGGSGSLRLGIRPEHIELGAADGVACIIAEIVFKGPSVSIIAHRPDGRQFTAMVPAAQVADQGLTRGGPVIMGFPARHLVGLSV